MHVVTNIFELLEGKLLKFRIEFDKLEIDVDNWEYIRKGSKYQIKELKEKIRRFKNDLLMNHIYKFQSNINLFDVEASKIITKKSSIEKGKR